MPPEIQFQLVNLAALPFWMLMLLAPSWGVTRRVMESFAAPLLFAVIYTVMVVPGLMDVLPKLMRPDLDTIATLLGDRRATVIAWVHFLAFDLFVGRWEYLDARERGLTHWLLAPCLFLTLMLGPLGLLCYLGARLAAPGKGTA